MPSSYSRHTDPLFSFAARAFWPAAVNEGAYAESVAAATAPDVFMATGSRAVTSAEPGNVRPIVYGRAVVPGQVIWSDEITDYAATDGRTATRWTGAVALCEGPIDKVVAIRANGKAFYGEYELITDDLAIAWDSDEHQWKLTTTAADFSQIAAGTKFTMSGWANGANNTELIEIEKVETTTLWIARETAYIPPPPVYSVNCSNCTGDISVSVPPDQFTGLISALDPFTDPEEDRLVAESAPGDITLTMRKYPGGLVDSLTIYTGTEAQVADPTIKAAEGVANTPAFRGTAYVVLKNFITTDFGGDGVPNLEFEVLRSVNTAGYGTGDWTPGLMLRDLAARCGLADLDEISGGGHSVDGYAITGHTSALAVIADIQAAYPLSLVDTGAGVRLVERRGQPIARIPEDDFGASDRAGQLGRPLREERLPETALPVEVSLSYRDNGWDQQRNTQTARRYTGGSGYALQGQHLQSVGVSFSMTGAQALKAAGDLLGWAWMRRRRYSGDLPMKWRWLEPGMIVVIDRADGSELTVTIDQIWTGANNIARFEARGYEDIYWTGDITVPTLPAVYERTFRPRTRFEVLNIPALDSDHNDAGFYVAAWPSDSAGRWDGATLYDSPDGTTFTEIGRVRAESVRGTVTATPGTSYALTLDRVNSLTVTVENGTLASLAAVYDLFDDPGDNVALVGNEIIFFATVVDNGGGSYTLSNLLRGRYGTEYWIDDHATDERFILLGNVVRIAAPAKRVGRWRFLKAISFGRNSEPDYRRYSSMGRALVPWPPVHVEGTRDGSDNLTIDWTRVARVDGELRDYADVPLAEDEEKYRVKVYNGATLVRTIDATSETASYTAAQQTTDFGAPQSSLDITVQQVSLTVGEGVPAEATV